MTVIAIATVVIVAIIAVGAAFIVAKITKDE